MKISNIKKSYKSTLPIVLGAAALVPVMAAAEEFMLEEITVTATKRAESIQDIPMSVEAVSGDMLRQQGISDFEDLSASIPNFSVGEGIATTQIVMRGMGSGNNRGFEQSVGMFTDGIYMPRSRQYVTPFLDVDRVEVLRGPQAVMFGLNSTAGSVSVVSAKTNPGDEFHAEVTGEYELEYDGFSTTSVIGGSPTDTLGLRLLYQNKDSGDGTVDNQFTGKGEGDIASETGRLTAVWQPTEPLTITAKLDYSEWDQNGSIGEIYGPGGAAFDGDGQLNWKTSSDASTLGLMLNDGPGQYVISKNSVITVDYALGEHTLTAIAGYSNFDYDLGVDLDTTSANPGLTVDAAIIETYEQSSFEMRWVSPEGKALEYIAGIYYQDSNSFQDQPTGLISTAASAGRILSNMYDQDAELWSAFASTTWNLSDSFRLIGGVRYTDETKEWEGRRYCIAVAPGISGEPELFPNDPCTGNTVNEFKDRSSTNVMPELVAQWDMNEDIMFYGKLGKSAKAGGFTTGGAAFDDESVLGLEFGMKSTLLDNTAELNVVVFRNEFDDLQVNSFSNTVPPVALTENAGSSVNQGIEVDGRWAVADWLTLSGSMAYLDAEYDEFERGPCPVGQADPCDLSGSVMPFAADFSGRLSADMRFSLTASMDLTAAINVDFSDEYYSEPEMNKEAIQDGWTKLSARIGVESTDDRWSVSLIGKNLTEDVAA